MTEPQQPRKIQQLLDNQEFQSAFVRFAIWVFSIIYISLAADNDYYSVNHDQFSALFLSYFIVFSLILTSIFFRAQWEARKLFTLFVDISAVSFCIFLTNDSVSPFFLFYIWIFVSYGTRYGLKYLKLSSLLSLVTYAIVVLSLNQIEEYAFEIGFVFLSLLVLPFYQLVLQRKLHQARHAAERSSNAKGFFLENMSNELTLPLSGIQGIAQMMIRTARTPEQHENLRRIISDADILRARIGDAVDIAKIGTGDLHLDRHEVDIRAMLMDVCSTKSGLALERGQEIVCRVAENIPSVIECDYNRLKQILFNLLDNAIANSHGVDVEISVYPESDLSPSRLCIDILSSVEDVTSDDAIELLNQASEEDYLEKLTEYSPLLRLAIVRQLATSMRIVLSADTRSDGSRTIHLAIPVENAITVTRYKRSDSLKGVNGFIYEKNEKSRTQLVSLLDAHGVRCRTASKISDLSGEFSELQKGDIDFAVIADAPDRFQDLERIGDVLREHLGEQLPIVYLGFSDRDVGISQSATAFVTKPFIGPELIRKLERLLRHETRAANASGSPEVNALRILVAEDNRVNGMMLCSLIADLGCEAYWARDGVNALEVVCSGEFDLALIDLGMPKMDGLTFTKNYRKSEAADRNLPIIAMSVVDDSELRRKCTMAGMDDVLVKPLDKQSLRRMIQTMIRRSDQELLV